jgi:mannose-1-phosphate guanylyltransferase
MNIVIMAGGGGSRLWPLSRLKQPKQFLDLGSGKTLIQHAYDRARSLVKPDDIYVATVVEYKEKIKELLPDVPPEHIFCEPSRRDTGPAFAAAAIQLKQRGKHEDPTIFMWSDHMFTNEQEFMKDLHKIPCLIEQFPDAVVIAGHKAIFPETGVGYLEVGERVFSCAWDRNLGRRHRIA